MSVVKINAIEVDPERGPELEERFAKRASEVEKMPGFEGFELLRPVAGETRYFVYTRWESEEAFAAFGNDRLGPAMAKLGVAVAPEVTFHPAHEVYLPQAISLT